MDFCCGDSSISGLRRRIVGCDVVGGEAALWGGWGVGGGGGSGGGDGVVLVAVVWNLDVGCYRYINDCSSSRSAPPKRSS